MRPPFVLEFPFEGGLHDRPCAVCGRVVTVVQIADAPEVIRTRWADDDQAAYYCSKRCLVLDRLL